MFYCRERDDIKTEDKLVFSDPVDVPFRRMYNITRNNFRRAQTLHTIHVLVSTEEHSSTLLLTYFQHIMFSLSPVLFRTIPRGNGTKKRFLRVGEGLIRVHNYRLWYKRIKKKDLPESEQQHWDRRFKQTREYLFEKKFGKRESHPDERVYLPHERALLDGAV